MSLHAHAQLPAVALVFVRRFPSTRRHARRARLLGVEQLEDWGVARDGEVGRGAAVVLSELAANAVTHGHVSGRHFEIRLTLTDTVLHIEVTDTRTDAIPPGPGALAPPRDCAESGRGLLLVDALADRWGVESRLPSPGKTVWAELDLGAR